MCKVWGYDKGKEWTFKLSSVATCVVIGSSERFLFNWWPKMLESRLQHVLWFATKLYNITMNYMLSFQSWLISSCSESRSLEWATSKDLWLHKMAKKFTKQVIIRPLWIDDNLMCLCILLYSFLTSCLMILTSRRGCWMRFICLCQINGLVCIRSHLL